MRSWTVVTIIIQFLLIAGLVFIKGWANLQSNLSVVAAAKYFVDDEQFSPDIIPFLLEQSPPSTPKLTTAVLLAIGLQETDIKIETEMLLARAMVDASVNERQAIGVRLEEQGERWARRGQIENGVMAFELVRQLDWPYPEPYLRMAEFARKSKVDIGIPYTKAYQLAIDASADSPRDNAFKSMAHTRLCVYVLENKQEYKLAEYHCRQAIHLDTYGVYTTWYTPTAKAYLGRALAEQGRYAEAEAILYQAIQSSRSANYVARAWYYLGFFVWEPQELWEKALEAYQQVENLGPKTNRLEAARQRRDSIQNRSLGQK